MLIENNYTINILEDQKKFKSITDELLEDMIKEVDIFPHNVIRDALFPGRRLRPTLFFMLLNEEIHFSRMTTNNLAVVIELAHRSSIIIDDLIDMDEERRQTPVFNKVHGVDNTILLSHYLVSLAYGLLLEIEESLREKAIKLLNIAYRDMTYGEYSDLGNINNISYIDLYKNYIIRKTSALFKLVFAYASLVSDINSEQKLILSSCGQKLGELYQIYNDIYDTIYSDNNERGNNGINKITLSLPICYLLDNYSNEYSKIIKTSIGKQISFSDFDEIKTFLKKPMIEKYLIRFRSEIEDDLQQLIVKIDQNHIKTIVESFFIWLKQKNCWDHKQYQTAGY